MQCGGRLFLPFLLSLLLMAELKHALIPSQVILKMNKFIARKNMARLDPEVCELTNPFEKLSHQNSPTTPSPVENTSTDTDSSPLPLSKDESDGSNDLVMKGKLANVEWRTISMATLRLHPLYSALPTVHPSSSSSTLTPKDLSLFSQDSEQWWMLHRGRLTTSTAAACLGFYESKTSAFLDIPRGLRGHARSTSAWSRLRETPLKDLNSLLTYPAPTASLSTTRPDSSPWRKSDNANSFPYTLLRNGKRRGQGRGYATDRSARLAWGSSQEPIAILAAVNALHLSSPSSSVHEVGLCPLEALDSSFLPEEVRQWIAEGSLPLIGASPDGLIKHANGSIEVLEVKCSSPFISSHKGSNEREGTGEEGSLEVGSSSRGKEGVPVWHIAQLQLEILCAGPQCSGALLITLTALDGASVYRIPRDDAYILEMLRWLRYFKITFCSGGKKARPPPPDFLRPGTSVEYRAFLDNTKRLAKCAKLVQKLTQEEIQRSEDNANFFWA